MRRCLPDGERGATTFYVLFLIVPLIIVGGVIVVDLGRLFVERREIQGAVDFAALAGAAELPDEDSAIAYAREWLIRNSVDVDDPGVTVEIITPYDGSDRKIEVRASRPVNLLFFPILGGIGPQQVGARAVARYSLGDEGPITVFANNPECPTGNEQVDFPGSDMVISGRVHSNGSFKTGGYGNDFIGTVTYLCELDVSGSAVDFIPDDPVQLSNVLPMPLDYEWEDFLPLCNWLPDGKLPDGAEGILCYDGDLDASEQYLTANVTLVATGKITLAGSDGNFTPYYEGLLAFSTAAQDPAIVISGQNTLYEGIVFAPNGGIVFSGSDGLQYSASLIADRVTISGQNFGLEGYLGASELDLALALIE